MTGFLHLPRVTILVIAVVPVIGVRSAESADRSAIQAQSILKKYCVGCHNAKDAEGGLVLATHAGLVKGGETGPAMVAGKVESSLLVKLIERRGKPLMPPKGNRGPRPSEIAVLKAWIAGGAKPFPSSTRPRH